MLCGTQDLDFASGFLKDTHWFAAGSCDRGGVHSTLLCTGITPRTEPSKKRVWVAREEAEPGISTVLRAKPSCWGQNRKDHCKCRVLC